MSEWISVDEIDDDGLPENRYMTYWSDDDMAFLYYQGNEELFKGKIIANSVMTHYAQAPEPPDRKMNDDYLDKKIPEGAGEPDWNNSEYQRNTEEMHRLDTEWQAVYKKIK